MGITRDTKTITFLAVEAVGLPYMDMRGWVATTLGKIRAITTTGIGIKIIITVGITECFVLVLSIIQATRIGATVLRELGADPLKVVWGSAPIIDLKNFSSSPVRDWTKGVSA
jgi:hypothetical protein